MEAKKTPKADLEKGKDLFLLMGFVMVLSFIFIAFEWTKSEVKKYEVQNTLENVGEEEIIPVTERPQTPPPPPPPEPVTPEVLVVVDNKTEVASIQINTEDQPSAAVVILPPVANDEPDDETVFVIVEKSPEFPGGEAAMYKFISNAIRYPAVAQDVGIQGRVTCQFVVNKDGSITDIEVVRGVDPSLDKEAIRVIGSMPKWRPGEQRGKSVRVKYTLPIVFRLQ
jgi:protein TonB